MREVFIINNTDTMLHTTDKIQRDLKWSDLFGFILLGIISGLTVGYLIGTADPKNYPPKVSPPIVKEEQK